MCTDLFPVNDGLNTFFLFFSPELFGDCGELQPSFSHSNHSEDDLTTPTATTLTNSALTNSALIDSPNNENGDDTLYIIIGVLGAGLIFLIVVICLGYKYHKANKPFSFYRRFT